MNKAINENWKELVINNRGLVLSTVSKLGIATAYYEQCLSTGTYGLILAAQTFDSSKGVAFSTYATKCIRANVILELKTINKHNKNTISIELPSDSGENLTLGETLQSNDIQLDDRIIQRTTLARVLEIILNDFDIRRQRLSLYLLAGIKKLDIIRICDVSRQNIAQMETRIHAALKESLENYSNTYKLFWVSFENNIYKISINKLFIPYYIDIFSSIFQKFNYKTSDLKIICNKDEISIEFILFPEFFLLILSIIEELNSPGKYDPALTYEISSKLKVKKIVLYILSLKEFCLQELLLIFSNENKVTVQSAIKLLKASGYLAEIDKNTYIVNRPQIKY